MSIWGLKEQAGEPYMPSNGTEGACFHEAWCCKCERDKAMNGTCHREGRTDHEDDWCEILGRSFRDEPLPEWVHDKDGYPSCTAFVPMGEKIPPPRDDKTIDMFGSQP